jgi:uncharacterized repeat protein (TIGR01451 family)
METRNRNKTNNTLTNHNTTIGDTNMRTHKLFSRFGLAMVAILLLSSMQHVYAAGTLAGTTITNVASVQYNAGVNVRNGTSNIITMVVGYKVVINLSPSNSSTTTVDSTSIYKAYTVTNTGNYADSLQFTVTHLPAGWIDTVFYDKDASGTETPGDSVLTSGGAGFWTAISGSHAILLKITLPGYAQAPDNMIDSVTVTTASYGSGPGAVVRVGGNGLQKYTANVTIAQPVLTVTGAQSVTGSPAIPGSAFAYTLTLQNTGHLAIQDGATLSFKLDSNFNFTSATNSGSNGSVNWAGDGGTVTWTLSHTDLPATMGSPITRTVNVTIQQVTKNGTGAAAGSLISIMDSTKSTTTNLVFNDGVNTHTIATAKLTQVTVAQASGAYLIQLTANQSGNPGDSVVYQFRVKNRGNAAMTFTLSQAQSGGNLDTVHLFTATSGVAGSQPFTTASINAGDSLGLYVYLRVNVTGLNANTIIRLLSAAPGTAGSVPTGASNYNPTITITTTVTAPNLSIVLSQAWINGVGTVANPAPGDTIEYTLTITNSGSGIATNLTTSNAIPSNTTFGPNSYGVGYGILVDGVAKTNNVPDSDGAHFTANTVTVESTSVNGGGGTKIVKYRVAVN